MLSVTAEMLRLFSLTIYHVISNTEGKSIKKMTGQKNQCACCEALLSCQMPFSNS